MGSKRGLVIDPVTPAERKRLWSSTLKALDSYEFTELLLKHQGIGKGSWPTAAYAALCSLALVKALRRAVKP